MSEQFLSVPEARERRVCRICRTAIRVDGAPGWPMELPRVTHPVAVTLNYGGEFAHAQCLDIVGQAAESLAGSGSAYREQLLARVRALTGRTGYQCDSTVAPIVQALALAIIADCMCEAAVGETRCTPTNPDAETG